MKISEYFKKFSAICAWDIEMENSVLLELLEENTSKESESDVLKHLIDIVASNLDNSNED